MKLWKTTAWAAAIAGAAGLGASFSPVVAGQERAPRPAETRTFEMFTRGGGSRIGVSIADVEAAKGTAGVRVESVEEESPAAKAGLRAGDVVVEFDGERVRSVRQFTRLVGETPPGREVTAAVQREGNRVNVSITPTESSMGLRMLDDHAWRAVEEARELSRIMPMPPRPARPARPPRPPRPELAPAPPDPPMPPDAPLTESFFWVGSNQLGVSVSSLSDQLRDYFGVKSGVLVNSVEADSAAARAGLKAGDVIVSINGSEVGRPGDIRSEMRDVEAGGAFTLDIVRDKKPMTLKGKANERPSRRGRTI